MTSELRLGPFLKGVVSGQSGPFLCFLWIPMRPPICLAKNESVRRGLNKIKIPKEDSVGVGPKALLEQLDVLDSRLGRFGIEIAHEDV